MTPDRDSCCGVTSLKIPCTFQEINRAFRRRGAAHCQHSEPLWESARLRWGDMELRKYLLIAFGGALGSLARYWVSSAFAGRFGTRFPYGTFVVNLSACIILGFSVELLGSRMEFSPAWRYLVPIGFVGAYSTFSTFEWETYSNLQAGSLAIAGLYVSLSVLLGLAGVWCGGVIGKVIR